MPPTLHYTTLDTMENEMTPIAQIANKLVTAYDNAEILHEGMVLAIEALVINPPKGRSASDANKRASQLIRLGTLRAEGKRT